MDEVSNFCTGDICQPRAGAALEAVRDDPPWVSGWAGPGGLEILRGR